MILLVKSNFLNVPLQPGCVDLCFLSWPYHGLRTYTEGGEPVVGQVGDEEDPRDYLIRLWQSTLELQRVLKETGNLFVNLGDRYTSAGRTSYDSDSKHSPRGGPRPGDGGWPEKSLLGLPWRYALGCVDLAYRIAATIRDQDSVPYDPAPGLNLTLRSEIIWHRKNGMPESVKDRVVNNHEQVFHFSKGPQHYAATSEIPERTADGVGKKPPRSVWEIGTDPVVVPKWLNVKHPAPFPQELARRVIAGFSPPGVCVRCGQGRRPRIGTMCDQCGAFRPNNSKACPGCGHVRDWKEGREESVEYVAEDWSTAGRATPRIPGGYQDGSITDGWECDCWSSVSDEEDPGTSPAVVYDPCVGSGTTVGVADALGRIGIGSDLSSDYLKLAAWRVKNPASFAKTVTADRQTSLF